MLSDKDNAELTKLEARVDSAFSRASDFFDLKDEMFTPLDEFVESPDELLLEQLRQHLSDLGYLRPGESADETQIRAAIQRWQDDQPDEGIRWETGDDEPDLDDRGPIDAQARRLKAATTFDGDARIRSAKAMQNNEAVKRIVAHRVRHFAGVEGNTPTDQNNLPTLANIAHALDYTTASTRYCLKVAGLLGSIRELGLELSATYGELRIIDGERFEIDLHAISPKRLRNVALKYGHLLRRLILRFIKTRLWMLNLIDEPRTDNWSAHYFGLLRTLSNEFSTKDRQESEESMTLKDIVAVFYGLVDNRVMQMTHASHFKRLESLADQFNELPASTRRRTARSLRRKARAKRANSRRTKYINYSWSGQFAAVSHAHDFLKSNQTRSPVAGSLLAWSWKGIWNHLAAAARVAVRIARMGWLCLKAWLFQTPITTALPDKQCCVTIWDKTMDSTMLASAQPSPELMAAHTRKLAWMRDSFGFLATIALSVASLLSSWGNWLGMVIKAPRIIRRVVSAFRTLAENAKVSGLFDLHQTV